MTGIDNKTYIAKVNRANVIVGTEMVMVYKSNLINIDRFRILSTCHVVSLYKHEYEEKPKTKTKKK